MSWRCAAAVLAAALMAAGCGGEDPEDGAEAVATATATPTASATPAGTPSPAPTAPAESRIESALWPDPSRATPDPAAAARSFVGQYIGLDRPHLGEFAQGEPGVGEIAVFATGEDGRRLDRVVSILTLRQLDGTNWFVTSAQSKDVEVTRPQPLATLSSPATVAGRGRGFEGNVVLQIRQAFSTAPLVEVPVIAGAMEQLERFEASLAFEPPATATGAVVALSGSGVSVANGFTAFPVRLAS